MNSGLESPWTVEHAPSWHDVAFDTLSNTISDTVSPHTTPADRATAFSLPVQRLSESRCRASRPSYLSPLIGLSLIGRSGAPSRSQDFIFSAVALAHSGFVTVSGSLPPDEGTRIRGREVFRISVRRRAGRIREGRFTVDRFACRVVVFSRRLGLMRPSIGRHVRDATRCGTPRSRHHMRTIRAQRFDASPGERGRASRDARGRLRSTNPAERGHIFRSHARSRTEGHVEREELSAGRGPSETDDRGDADGTSGGFNGSDDTHDAVTRAS